MKRAVAGTCGSMAETTKGNWRELVETIRDMRKTCTKTVNGNSKTNLERMCRDSGGHAKMRRREKIFKSEAIVQRQVKTEGGLMARAHRALRTIAACNTSYSSAHRMLNGARPYIIYLFGFWFSRMSTHLPAAALQHWFSAFGLDSCACVGCLCPTNAVRKPARAAKGLWKPWSLPVCHLLAPIPCCVFSVFPFFIFWGWSWVFEVFVSVCLFVFCFFLGGWGSFWSLMFFVVFVFSFFCFFMLFFVLDFAGF